MKKYIISLLILLATTSVIIGHGGSKNNKQDSTKVAGSQVQGNDDHEEDHEEAKNEHGTMEDTQQVNQGGVTASFGEFPNPLTSKK